MLPLNLSKNDVVVTSLHSDFVIFVRYAVIKVLIPNQILFRPLIQHVHKGIFGKITGAFRFNDFHNITQSAFPFRTCVRPLI